MDTLRGALASAGVRKFRNKPDRFSQGYELRRFAAEGTASRPPTDFFELYWAPHFGPGRLGATLAWALRLLVRRPFWHLDPQLRGAMGVLQVSVVALAVAIVWLLARRFGEDGFVGAIGWASGVFAAVAAVVNLVAGYVVTRVLADAARYLTPKPEHVTARNAIRQEGVQLLHSLHDSGAYERIVVVGHSLGSVIGLDILRITFDELRHPNPATPEPNDEAKRFSTVVRDLPATPTRGEVDLFQQGQRRLWRELRARGARWLVTDFVTLGSPLAHAPLLLDGKRATLRQRQEEGEYPTCPPTGDILYPRTYELEDGRRRTGLVLDHGAVFAATTWSNAWFPVRRVFGDPVGGPLAPIFGRGVKDVQVRLTSRRRHRRQELFLAAHTTYFRRDLDDDAEAAHVDSGADEAAKAAAASVRDARKALDEESRTKVAHVAFEAMLLLNSRRGVPLPPPPAPRSRSAQDLPPPDQL
ncbi:hypothetical protein [Ornithinimicrobium sp. LYQ103]|uniref:hypothetical protein n=1 Tax=Ornithinimicrobium sp. LYQ103 TaxID=3378796 RepID=UPI0038524996